MGVVKTATLSADWATVKVQPISSATASALSHAEPKLLKIKGGPLIAILGYRGRPPADSVVSAIVARMGATLKAGANEGQWVPAWMEINAENSSQNTWNAGGLDRQGYWWIQKRGILERGSGPTQESL